MWTRAEFETQLRAKEARYHSHRPGLGKTTLGGLINGLEAAVPGAELRLDVVELSEVAYPQGSIRMRSGGEP